MSGHSKGPWEAWKEGDDWKVGSEDLTVAYVQPEPYVPEEARGDEEANAKLIAAAPDRYEALREVAFQFGPLEEAKLLGTADVEALYIVRAALAKAEGR